MQHPASSSYPVQGAGLGLRRGLLGPLAGKVPEQVDFMEVAPENWMGIGGRLRDQFRRFTEQVPFVCHGLSLSIGSPDPLDKTFLNNLKQFLDDYGIAAYTEHLTYCSDDGQMYDLLPIPFTEEAVRYVSGRVKQVQDVLERRIALENASYYAAPGQEMSEIEFIRAVIDEADCDLLLDVNNIYVNSINHRYDAEAFLTSLPGERIVYAHIAGHYKEAEDLRVDTHGAPVVDPVWRLLEKAYEAFGVFPTLLERDFNFPPLAELLGEVDMIADRQRQATSATELKDSVSQ